MKPLTCFLLLILLTFSSCTHTDNLPNCGYVVEDNIVIEGVVEKFQLVKVSEEHPYGVCKHLFRKKLKDGRKKVVFDFVGYDKFMKYEVTNDSLYLFAKFHSDSTKVSFVRFGIDELKQIN